MRTHYTYIILWLFLSAPAAFAKPFVSGSPTGPMNEVFHSELLNQFYLLRHEQPHIAEETLYQLLAQNPNNLVALKELGYHLLQDNRKAEARIYFERAVALAPEDYTLHLQLAYILNSLGDNRGAYEQFSIAYHSPDPEIQRISANAMINLAGTQLQFLPSPYFADLYFSPYYISRFDDGIFPAKLRLGLEFGDQAQLELYLFGSILHDTESKGGELPIIFSDNAAIAGVGVQYQPTVLPIYVYSELGESYYLIDQPDKDRWDIDFRAGIFGYDEWGEENAYAPELTWGAKPNIDVYGNFTYYSRYDNDWIGQFRARPGLRVMNYHYTTFDFYWKGEVFFDTQQIYYNNVVQTGPGILFVPDQRWEIEFRLEALRGMYIPVETSDENPYDKYFNTWLAEAVIYLDF